MFTFVFSIYWVMCLCPISVESGFSNSKRPMHRTPPGCKQTMSQTTLQPMKMPQISSQKLDKPRNKDAIKSHVVFSSPYPQARAAMLNSERSERSQGWLFVTLQFLAWPGHKMQSRMLGDIGSGQRKADRGIFQINFLFFYFVLFL